jgi:hypothetical protein
VLVGNTGVRRPNHGGRPPVITDDMLHTVLRRRAGGESVEDIPTPTSPCSRRAHDRHNQPAPSSLESHIRPIFGGYYGSKRGPEQLDC